MFMNVQNVIMEDVFVIMNELKYLFLQSYLEIDKMIDGTSTLTSKEQKELVLYIDELISRYKDIKR